MALNDQLATENFALFDNSGILVGGLAGVVDVNPTIGHQQSVAVTPYPVESGGTLTDNAVIQPNQLNITAIVSDQLFSADTRLNVPAQARAGAAWGIIVDLLRKREPVTVVTQLQQYQNMLITDISSNQDKDTGLALIYNMRLTEVMFAQTKIVKFPPINVSGPAANRTSTVNRGDQQSITVTSAQEQAIRNNL